jgi:hypothetical protein
VRHPFVDSGERDDQDRQRCDRCYLPDENAIHTLPERTDEQRDTENRMVGER